MEAKAEVASLLHSTWLDGEIAEPTGGGSTVEAKAGLRGYDERGNGAFRRWSLDLWDRDGQEAVVSVVSKSNGEWMASSLQDLGCDDEREKCTSRASGDPDRDDSQADFSLEDYFENTTFGWKRWVGWLKDADGRSLKGSHAAADARP